MCSVNPVVLLALVPVGKFQIGEVRVEKTQAGAWVTYVEPDLGEIELTSGPKLRLVD